MGKTGIEWCDESWNPITGCTPISEGCANCYANRMANRLRGRFGYPKDDPFRPGTFHYNAIRRFPWKIRSPKRIFVCSMGDIFHEKANPNAIGHVCQEISVRPKDFTFIFLTKRPHMIAKHVDTIRVQWDGLDLLGNTLLLSNVWLGVSVENQKAAEERIPILLQIPAAKRFVSCEPLLEEIVLNYIQIGSRIIDSIHGHRSIIDPENKMFRLGHIEIPKLDWVIVGGETGPNARPANPDWFRAIRDDCRAAGVPFFMKKMSGGGEAPEDLRIREFPVS